MEHPLLPKATAVWLIQNSSLTFSQISKFCNLHLLEIQGIADGEVAKGIKGINPVICGLITLEELKRCENDPDAQINMSSDAMKIIQEQKTDYKKSKYVPIARRQDKPNAILWLIKNTPEMTDGQISKLIGTTKNTINLIRDKSHWNYPNLRPKDPVLLGLCSQADINHILSSRKTSKSIPPGK